MFPSGQRRPFPPDLALLITGTHVWASHLNLFLPQLILSCQMEIMTHGSGASESHSEEGIHTPLPYKALQVAAVQSAPRADGATRHLIRSLLTWLSLPPSQPACSSPREPAISIPLCIH